MIKKGYLLPHPPLLIKEIGKKRVLEVNKTRQAIEQATSTLKKIIFDTIMIIGPHAPVYPKGISLHTSSQVRGNFANFGYPDIAFVGDCDEEFIEHLLARQNIIKFNPLTNTPLDHGTMLPLYFLKQAQISVKMVISGISWENTEYHLEYGRIISETATELKRNILLIGSGDLSHRLNLNAPAGYDPQGKVFDNLVVNFFKTGDPASLLNINRETLERAGECGYRSLITLIGFFSAAPYKTRLFSYEGPFGVGYLVGGIEAI